MPFVIRPLTIFFDFFFRLSRPDYVKAIWDVIDWDVAGERLAAAK